MKLVIIEGFGKLETANFARYALVYVVGFCFLFPANFTRAVVPVFVKRILFSVFVRRAFFRSVAYRAFPVMPAERILVIFAVLVRRLRVFQLCMLASCRMPMLGCVAFPLS